MLCRTVAIGTAKLPCLFPLFASGWIPRNKEEEEEEIYYWQQQQRRLLSFSPLSLSLEEEEEEDGGARVFGFDRPTTNL